MSYIHYSFQDGIDREGPQEKRTRVPLTEKTARSEVPPSPLATQQTTPGEVTPSTQQTVQVEVAPSTQLTAPGPTGPSPPVQVEVTSSTEHAAPAEFTHSTQHTAPLEVTTSAQENAEISEFGDWALSEHSIIVIPGNPFTHLDASQAKMKLVEFWPKMKTCNLPTAKSKQHTKYGFDGTVCVSCNTSMIREKPGSTIQCIGVMEGSQCRRRVHRSKKCSNGSAVYVCSRRGCCTQDDLSMTLVMIHLHFMVRYEYVMANRGKYVDIKTEICELVASTTKLAGKISGALDTKRKFQATRLALAVSSVDWRTGDPKGAPHVVGSQAPSTGLSRLSTSRLFHDAGLGIGTIGSRSQSTASGVDGSICQSPAPGLEGGSMCQSPTPGNVSALTNRSVNVQRLCGSVRSSPVIPREGLTASDGFVGGVWSSPFNPTAGHTSALNEATVFVLPDDLTRVTFTDAEQDALQVSSEFTDSILADLNVQPQPVADDSSDESVAASVPIDDESDNSLDL